MNTLLQPKISPTKAFNSNRRLATRFEAQIGAAIIAHERKAQMPRSATVYGSSEAAMEQRRAEALAGAATITALLVASGPMRRVVICHQLGISEATARRWLETARQNKAIRFTATPLWVWSATKRNAECD